MKLSRILVALAIILLPVAAYAQTTVTAVPPGTAVVVPVGNWVDALVPQIEAGLGLVIAAIVTWALRSVPAAWMNQALRDQVDQVLLSALNYGFNSLDDALKGKEITIDVKNAILAQALQYVIDHAPPFLIKWMGGPDAIMEKLVARWHLGVAASGSAASVQATAAVAGALASAAP